VKTVFRVGLQFRPAMCESSQQNEEFIWRMAANPRAVFPHHRPDRRITAKNRATLAAILPMNHKGTKIEPTLDGRLIGSLVNHLPRQYRRETARSITSLSVLSLETRVCGEVKQKRIFCSISSSLFFWSTFRTSGQLFKANNAAMRCK